MDYEKKYKDVLEKLRDFYRDYDTVSHLIDVKEELANLFPELKESEDERIRKALIRFHKSSIDIDGIKGDDILAWLEKQGEQKSANEEMIEALRTEYEKGRTDAIAEMQVAWSEEDDITRKALINLVEMFYGYCIDKSEKNRLLDWLKSLKQRYTWKPSEEQMKALHDLNLTGGISYAGQGQELINLYNDLYKLKA